MRLNPPLSCLLLLSMVFMTACGEVEDTRPGQPVKQRQEAFKAMLRAFEPMGTMLRDKRYHAERFAQGAQALAEWRDAPWAHFGPGTQYPPSKARDAIWSQPEAFAQARERFVTAVDGLTAAVAAGQQPAIEQAYQQVYDSCQSCHKQFRER